jgi:predicted RNase H-like nuclease (RuvC/YqgF family)
MEITKKHLIDVIHEIRQNIDQLKTKIQKQAQIIEDLKLQNMQLKKNNSDTLDHIKQYIEELEQIRSRYVDSNNKSSK